MAEIKDRIVSLRNEKNITQSQLAEELNISPSAIGMYEQGRRKPSNELLEEICDYFNVDMDYLMGRSDIKNRYQAGLKYDWEDKKQEDSNIDMNTVNTDYIMIPLYESISAGYGASNSEFIEMIPVFGLKKNGTTYFAVKVEGDSMEPKIPNGSTIIIKKDIQIESGEIGAFNLNDENFVKQKKVVKDRLILHSFNLAYEDKVVNEFDDFIEYGKVVKVMIDL
ncbi:XRE family transcriptional regulator [Fusobacterium pseudoperiodonticum]|uniref:helix-turn-helix domain-containing protein n=1 Tax=Fusobacterium pseudoperiodonticum TaxID=2663009 RepID=UPI0028F125CE|nr:XRE family transcriptional regulator [Fusobacterium pseudoperiodonticum]